MVPKGSSTGLEKQGSDGAGNEFGCCWIFQRNSGHTQSRETPKSQAQAGDAEPGLEHQGMALIPPGHGKRELWDLTWMGAGSGFPAPSKSSAIPTPNPPSSQILISWVTKVTSQLCWDFREAAGASALWNRRSLPRNHLQTPGDLSSTAGRSREGSLEQFQGSCDPAQPLSAPSRSSCCSFPHIFLLSPSPAAPAVR